MTTPADHIDIVVNGDAHAVSAGTTVAALIAQLGMGERRVAIERNREIVPRSRHAETVLADGDRIEIVHALGGG